jgi:hypothetical protein
MMHLCAGKFVVFQVDAQKLIGIVNHESPRLNLIALTRELFWFGLEHRITLAVEFVPREENFFADEISKWLIRDDCILSRKYLCELEDRRTGGVQALAYDLSGMTAWIHGP